MQLNGFLQVFGVAVAGGALIELYKWYGLRESTNFPHYVRRPAYWLITLAMVLAGGFLATLYGTSDVQAVLALNIGLSAPAIIRTLSKAGPADSQHAPPPRRPDDRRAGGGHVRPPSVSVAPTPRNFLAGV
jgi:hypothetical protein